MKIGFRIGRISLKNENSFKKFSKIEPIRVTPYEYPLWVPLNGTKRVEVKNKTILFGRIFFETRHTYYFFVFLKLTHQWVKNYKLYVRR